MKRKNEFYEGIMEGLNELVDEVKSKKKTLKRTHLSIKIEPIKEYTALEIKKIRENTGFSQNLFAKYLGVSKRTVEAWESGKNTPSGSSSRLLSMFELNKNLVKEYPFIVIEKTL